MKVVANVWQKMHAGMCTIKAHSESWNGDNGAYVRWHAAVEPKIVVDNDVIYIPRCRFVAPMSVNVKLRATPVGDILTTAAATIADSLQYMINLVESGCVEVRYEQAEEIQPVRSLAKHSAIIAMEIGGETHHISLDQAKVVASHLSEMADGKLSYVNINK